MNSKQTFEYLIRRIYATYAPSKSAEVSGLLKKYDGQENELFERICKKYGVSEHEIRVFQAELNDGEMEAKNGRFKKSVLSLIGLLIVLTVIFIVKVSSESVSNREAEETVVAQNLPNEMPIERTEPVPAMNKQMIEKTEEENSKESEKHYVVLSKTFFHDSTSGSSKRKAYLVDGEMFSSKIEQNGFLFVEFVNPKGQKTKGWIRKDDAIAQTDSNVNSNRIE